MTIAAATDARPVLVVEDDDDIRRLLTRRLTMAGHHVTACGTGEQALEALAGDPHGYAAMVLDIILPGVDGWEVARRTRTVIGASHLPILVASVLDDADLPAWLGNAKAIKKPLGRGVIEAAIAELTTEQPTGADSDRTTNQERS